MNCREALNAMHEALDHEASLELQSALDAHLRGCADCARECAAWAQWDRVLRAPEADEPDEAYFGALAQRVSGAVAVQRRHAERRTPRLMPSWGLSWAAAAACLVLGLGFGHFALPRTLTQARTVVKTVPGPVRTVTVEKIVEKPVRVPVRVAVPVIRWRTRTVERAPMAEVALVRAARDASLGPPTMVGTTGAPSSPVADAVVTEPRRVRMGGTLVAYRPDTGLTRNEMRALATRFTTDVGALDRALNSPTLAATLVSNVGDASAELDKAVRSEAAEAHQP